MRDDIYSWVLTDSVMSKTGASARPSLPTRRVIELLPHVLVMNLGQVMEVGSAAEVAAEPLHPYTQALFAFAPSMNPDERLEGPPLTGDPPNRIDPPSGCRFRLKQPWPDFLSFYGTLATGAGWVVPRHYVEYVGEDGFKGASRRRALSLRLFHTGRGAGARGERELLAQGAEREAPGLQVHPGCDHASGRA
jgi:oligopeptide/dipeptide ABC transporter ATP-binding protein